MIPLLATVNWFKVAAVAGAVVLAVGLVWRVQAFIDDRDAALLDAELSRREAIQARADARVIKAEATIEKEYAGKHLELVETTSERMVQFALDAAVKVTASQLTERAATDEGRADLNRRAAERTRQIYDEMEALSDYGPMYLQLEQEIGANQ